MIGVVACSKTKLTRRAPARELYTSPLFRMSLEYALARCDQVFIASARHGLVTLDTVLEPYDETLTGKPAHVRDAWGFAACRQLIGLRPATETTGLFVLAGFAYTSPIRRHLDERYTLIDALHGMQIGQRLHFLRGELAAETQRAA